MYTTEKNVRKSSDYYIHTAGSLAEKAFLYPIALGLFSYEPGYSLYRSSYDSFLLFYVKSGKCQVETNGNKYIVHEGQFAFINCYLPHAYSTVDGYDALWLHFDGHNALDYYNMIINEFSPVITLKNSSRIMKYLQNFYDTFRNGTPYKEVLFNNWIVNILTELILAKDSERPDVITEEMFDDLINYINEHLTDKLSLEFLASRVSLSPFYFTRVFKKETGFTPHEYVISARVNAAKFLLKTTPDSVKEICYKTGFSGESVFCTSFKNKTGITPSDYRNEQII